MTGTATTTADLNLRAGPGTANRVLAVLPKGTRIQVTGDPFSGWWPVRHLNTSGWCSGKYLNIKTDIPPTTPPPELTPAQQRFPAVAKKYLGKLYRWGGNGPDHFDCSGYTWWVLRDMGFVANRAKHSADNQMQQFRSGTLKGVKIVSGNYKPGDIMFFGGNKNKATHVTFYLGDGLLIGANGGGRSTLTDAIARRAGAMVRTNKVDYRHDLIEAWRPEYQ